MFPDGYTKLLVGVGVSNEGYTTEMEVLDLSDPGAVCKVPTFQGKLESPVSGLVNGQPLMCGNCFRSF